MDLEAVCIDNHGGTADCGKVKPAFPFFNEIFHFTAATVKLDHLVRCQIFHCCNNESVNVYDLPIRFFNLEDYPAGMAP